MTIHDPDFLDAGVPSDFRGAFWWNYGPLADLIEETDPAGWMKALERNNVTEPK